MQAGGITPLSDAQPPLWGIDEASTGLLKEVIKK
jgi:hypothetical protein